MPSVGEVLAAALLGSVVVVLAMAAPTPVVLGVAALVVVLGFGTLLLPKVANAPAKTTIRADDPRPGATVTRADGAGDDPHADADAREGADDA